MTQETLNKLERLQEQLFRARRDRGWMEQWGEELYRPDNDPEVPDKFLVSISRNDKRCVFQREISREDVESEYIAALQELDKRIAEIEYAALPKKIEKLEKEIADL